MSKPPHVDRKVLRRYIELLGNPYAKSQLIGGDELDLEEAQGGELREPSEAEREYARRQANQYTLLSVAIVESKGVPQQTQEGVASSSQTLFTLGVSKRDFAEGCRRIFRHYIPAVEKGRLRRHHRDFINRNQNRTATERHLLLQELGRYDLSAIAGVESRFNRERVDVTEQKLRQIEESVLDKAK